MPKVHTSYPIWLPCDKGEFIIDGPNPKKRKEFTINDHSSESKAFWKSIKSSKPGMFSFVAYWMIQSMSRIFFPINLFFMNPV